MSRHRFFLEAPLPAADGEVALPLSAGDLHHAVSVLRVRAGEEIDVVEPGGRVWRVRIEHASTQALIASPAEEIAGTSGPRVTLVFGVSKGAKNDDIVEGATEVGVSEFVPVLTERSIVRLDDEKRAERGERCRRVALAAAKQSKRATVPEVSDPRDFAGAIERLVGYGLVLVAWEESDVAGRGVREAIEGAELTGTSPSVALVVGPEGGLTGEEVAALERAGGVAVTLGSNILRAERAAVVGAALVVHELGGLGNAR
jgi:16S rRNA (uracil1498-N3)-methyltransferase